MTLSVKWTVRRSSASDEAPFEDIDGWETKAKTDPHDWETAQKYSLNGWVDRVVRGCYVGTVVSVRRIGVAARGMSRVFYSFVWLGEGERGEVLTDGTPYNDLTREL